MYKKNLATDINYYKIGYQNYNEFLSRKYLCYLGKRITFKWSEKHFFNSLPIMNSIYQLMLSNK